MDKSIRSIYLELLQPDKGTLKETHIEWSDGSCMFYDPARYKQDAYYIKYRIVKDELGNTSDIH
jgi:hypothetical protein